MTAIPLKKDDENPNELTTAELAHPKGPRSAELPYAGQSRPQGDEQRGNLRSDLSTQGGAAREHPPSSSAAESTPLFPDNELQDMQRNWDRIQTGFVDEPRRAVGDADQLVASTMQRLAKAFADERTRLEQQWDRGDNVSTEDLRVAFQRYRSFFRRLLSM